MYIPIITFKAEIDEQGFFIPIRKARAFMTQLISPFDFFCITLFRSIERILFTSFFSPAGFTISGGYWSRILGHLRPWPPSCTDCQPWPRSHASNGPVPDKMNIDHLKLLYYWISKVRDYDHDCSRWLAKKHTQIPAVKQQDISNPLFLTLIITSFSVFYLVLDSNQGVPRHFLFVSLGGAYWGENQYGCVRGSGAMLNRKILKIRLFGLWFSCLCYNLCLWVNGPFCLKIWFNNVFAVFGTTSLLRFR